MRRSCAEPATKTRCMKNKNEKLKGLIKLSHDLASPLQPLAILGEGNTSARLSDQTFIVSLDRQQRSRSRRAFWQRPIPSGIAQQLRGVRQRRIAP